MNTNIYQWVDTFGFKARNYQSCKLALVHYYQIRKRSISPTIFSYSQKQFRLSKSLKIIIKIGHGNCLINQVNTRATMNLCTNFGIQQESKFWSSTRIKMAVSASLEVGPKKMTMSLLAIQMIIIRYLS